MKMNRFDSSEGNVWKYVFDFGNAIAESVLYRYESFYKRTVLCISVQSGCPVGCVMCGSGGKFIRNLTASEIIEQVGRVLLDQNIEDINGKGERFQIMFMSMGEPFLNADEVFCAIQRLNLMYPNAELLISTIAPIKPEAWSKFLILSSSNRKVGLQFSIHEAFDFERDLLIPFKNKHTLSEIRDLGILWNGMTKRPVYINYCISEHNHGPREIERLKLLFSPVVFNFTFSVVCSADDTMKKTAYRHNEDIVKVMDSFIKDGYNVRKFDPAGQDDIGGGCGQLWYVQEWMKNRG
jgi:23S rRNA (adenine2503-C2)-methyltransferase